MPFTTRSPTVDRRSYAVWNSHGQHADHVPDVNICKVWGLGVSAGGIESFTVVFLGGHFLFTSSGTFAVGCIVNLATMHNVTDRRTDRRTDRQTETA